MNAPRGAEDCRYAELSICLPADWPMTEEALRNPRYSWPLELLSTLAYMPHAFRTWLWLFQAIPNFEPAQPYGPGTVQCGAMIVPSIRLPRGFAAARLPNGREVCFFDVLPLYSYEMDYAVSCGPQALLDLFDAADHDGVVAPRRPCVVPFTRSAQ